MKHIPIILALLTAVGLASCSAVRHCKSPELNLPEQVVPGRSDSLTLADLDWWEFYGDTTLCRIIERTLEHNKDLLSAAARVERMRQLYRIDKANRLPSVGLPVYAEYETHDYYGEKSVRDPELAAKVSLSWELDMWGNLRWAKRQGGAEYLASVEAERAMRMTLVAEVAAASPTSSKNTKTRNVQPHT